MAFYSAADRIREIQSHLREDAEAAQRELFRSAFIPRQGGPRPMRARNAALDSTLDRLEAIERVIHRLDGMVDIASRMPAEVHTALDAWEGRTESFTAGSSGVRNKPLADRLTRELLAPTNPFDREFDPEPGFDQAWEQRRRDLYAATEQHDHMTTGEQIEMARKVWMEYDLHEGMDSGFTGETDPLRIEEQVDTYLGPSDYKKPQDAAAFVQEYMARKEADLNAPQTPAPDARTTGDAELDSMLRENFNK